MFWILSLMISLVTFLYWKIRSSGNYWNERGVQQDPKGSLLSGGLRILMKKENICELSERIYKTNPNTRYSGCYQFFSPVLLIRDPDLIKQITVKDFDHFVNHKSFVPENGDPIFSKNLFSLKNQNWRDMRSTMSPAFTSSKMKYMFTLICQNGDQFVRYFFRKNQDIVTVEMKDVFTRFTNDVIANVAFGIEIDSLANQENEFYLMAKKLTDFSGFTKRLKFLGNYVVPKLYEIFKISPFSGAETDFFVDILKNNIETRQKQNIVRPDMINILLEHRSDEKTKITDLDIISQAMAFFFAGFETVSGLMSFMLYELAANPDIQSQLIQEVDKTLKSCDGKISYEALLGMKYMDMVVSETLRKWPPLLINDRLCSKPYTIEAKYPDEKLVHLNVNDNIWIPVFGLHRDPEYYPNPEKFNPERFNDENKGKILQYTYLPFGAGPRVCIGSRLALLETKILFFHLLANFEIVTVEKTQIPLKISRNQLNMTAEGGFWFGLKRRKEL